MSELGKDAMTSTPVPVEIVRPSRKPGWAVGRVIGSIGGRFLNAWLLMLILGALHTKLVWVPALGYWYTLLALIGIGLLRNPLSSWDVWSRTRTDKNLK